MGRVTCVTSSVTWGRDVRDGRVTRDLAWLREAVTCVTFESTAFTRSPHTLSVGERDAAARKGVFA